VTTGGSITRSGEPGEVWSNRDAESMRVGGKLGSWGR